ncbi:MAG TPA: hypothetical protein VMG35_01200 [Bryobacteraceae bacterium]|nr:hypothetical protein [Bryobacteraceae bacterium]
MAALGAILSALRRAVGRDVAHVMQANNLLLLALLGRSAAALFLMLGLLLLLPLSFDPLRKIPAARLALWPLSIAQRSCLRISSLALSPVVWIGALILLKTRQPGLALAFCALAVGVQTALVLGRYVAQRHRHADLLLDLPQFPGRMGGLVRKDIREMLCQLDPYAAAMLSLGGGAYRVFAAHPDPAAASILALLVALAMSTCAQSLFGLDVESGVTRYHLLPVNGWQILLAKGVAFLSILFVLLLPLDPWPGLTFALVALAFGHHSSVLLEQPQQRWRFAHGSLPFGALQTACGMGLGFVEYQRGPAVLALAAAAYLASAYYYGRRWERE